jgi:hypothetical protein
MKYTKFWIAPTGHKKLQKPRPPLVNNPKITTQTKAVNIRLEVKEMK